MSLGIRVLTWWCIFHFADLSYELPEKQQICMERALLSTNNVNHEIWRYLCAQDSHRSDALKWRGVECTGSMITGFVMTTPKSRTAEYDLSLAWLPNTIQYLYCKFVIFHNHFHCKEFPRDLRYMYVRSAEFIDGENSSGVFNLESLPIHMEELHLTTKHAFCGRVMITSLPQRLVSLTITNVKIKQVIVNNDGLPEGLQAVLINGGGPKIICATEKKPDRRVSNGKGISLYVRSKYAEKYAQMCGVIERETMGINI